MSKVFSISKSAYACQCRLVEGVAAGLETWLDASPDQPDQRRRLEMRKKRLRETLGFPRFCQRITHSRDATAADGWVMGGFNKLTLGDIPNSKSVLSNWNWDCLIQYGHKE